MDKHAWLASTCYTFSTLFGSVFVTLRLHNQSSSELLLSVLGHLHVIPCDNGLLGGDVAVLLWILKHFMCYLRTDFTRISHCSTFQQCICPMSSLLSFLARQTCTEPSSSDAAYSLVVFPCAGLMPDIILFQSVCQTSTLFGSVVSLLGYRTRLFSISC